MTTISGLLTYPGFSENIQSEAYGRTENPDGIGRTPGGSSGGSGAAAAAGLGAAALSTDTLGSLRIPVAYNGVYDLNPTNGLISDDGLVPLARKLDCIGPLSRSIGDLAAFTVLAKIVGLPALALPAGFDSDGMPVGMQIIGRQGREGPCWRWQEKWMPFQGLIGRRWTIFGRKKPCES